MKNVFLLLFVMVFVLVTCSLSLANKVEIIPSDFVSDIELPTPEEGPIRKGGEVIVVIGRETILSLMESDCNGQTMSGESTEKRLKVYANGQLIVDRAFEGNSTAIGRLPFVPQQLQVILEVGSCQTETTIELMPVE